MAPRKTRSENDGELAARARLASNAELVSMWREALRSRGLKPATVDRRAGILDEFATTVVAGRLLNVTHRELLAFKEMLDAEGATATQVDRHMTTLSSFFDWIKNVGVRSTNPVPQFRRRYLTIPLREERKRRIEFQTPR